MELYLPFFCSAIFSWDIAAPHTPLNLASSSFTVLFSAVQQAQHATPLLSHVTGQIPDFYSTIKFVFHSEVQSR